MIREQWDRGMSQFDRVGDVCVRIVSAIYTLRVAADAPPAGDTLRLYCFGEGK